MPANIRAEIIFISLMMIFIFIICGAVCYFFAKTYQREMKERKEQREAKRLAKEAAERAEQEQAAEVVNGPSLDT
ncbi:MAG TPA: hypothetical protein PLR83_11740 [Pyrinomonadaceae bacterium]|nr:hypothetical protein [Pyrinomonadaceae bacterium]